MTVDTFWRNKMLRNSKFLIPSLFIIVSVLASVNLVACGGGTPSTTTTHPPTTTNPPTTTTVPPTTTTVPPTTTTIPPTTTASGGAAIYASSTTNCAVCHGANRQGVSAGGIVIGPPIPVTDTFISSNSLTQIATFLATHQTGSSLTADQRTALATFLKTGN